MRALILGILFLLGSYTAKAQYQNITFNYEKSYFNGSLPLPAEKKFMVTGNVNPKVQLVEIKIYRDNIDDEPLYSANWKRIYGNNMASFSVPVNYVLRGNSDYTFVVNYFEPAARNERAALMKSISKGLKAYIDQSIEISNRNVRLKENYKVIMSDLNTIVNSGMGNYKNKSNIYFSGFSDIVKAKVKEIDNASLTKAAYVVKTAPEEEKRSIKQKYISKLLNDLLDLTVSEVSQVINTELLVITDSRIVRNYPTEKTINTIALNAGYGGVYDSGEIDNLTYGSGPFAGLSFSLGKKAFTSPFWSRTSISAGVFLTNLDLGNGKEVSGPLVNRPLYLGLGYKVLRFVRLNAGMTALQRGTTSFSDFNINKVYTRPYIGASIEFNLWLGLDK